MDLLIRVETDPIQIVVNQSYRKENPQFATLSLAHAATDEPRFEHMQLRFAHRPFETQQQPVIEMAGVI